MAQEATEIDVVVNIGANASEQHLSAAGTLTTVLPVIAVYVLFQRQFVQGITDGSLIYQCLEVATT